LLNSSLAAIFILLSIFLTILGEHQQYVRDEQAAVKAAGNGTPEYGVFSYLFRAVQSEAKYCLDMIKATVAPVQNDSADAKVSTSDESFSKCHTSAKENVQSLIKVLQAPSGGKNTPSGRRPSQRERLLAMASSASSPEHERPPSPVPETGSAGLSVLLANHQVLLKRMLSEQRDIKAEQKEIKAKLVTAQSTWMRAAPNTKDSHDAGIADEITDRAAEIDATISELLLEQKRIAGTVAGRFEVAPPDRTNRSGIATREAESGTVGVERAHGNGERRRNKEARRHRGTSTDVALLSGREINDSLAFQRPRNRHRKAESEPGSPTKYDTHWKDGSERPSPPESAHSSPEHKRRHRKHKVTDAAARTAAESAAEPKSSFII
jgi:hypothetical protein